MSEISLPSIEAVKESTYKAFAGKLEDSDIHNLLASLPASNFLSSAVVTNPDDATLSGTPTKIASASIYFGLVFGVISCEVDNKKFEAYSWGIGASALVSKGILYTAYDSWDALFQETCYYHAQGIAEAGGIFQISFMNSSHIPVGQFNGVAGGIAVFEVGGVGHWK